MSNVTILGNPKRRSRFDPDLARKVTEEYEIEERKNLLKKKKAPEINPPSPQQSDVRTNIKGEVYIRVPNSKVVISRYESYKGLDWKNTHYALADNGLFMPTPSLFMPYFVNVRNAAQGKITLYTADNKPVPRDEAEDLWKYLSSNHKGGCWTWLDAKFSENKNVWKITYNHKTVQKGKDNSLEGITETLEDCIREDCFVDLEFNKQGLPTRRSQDQTYTQGENIYYCHPRNGAIAWFDAVSGGAVLGCGWFLSVSDPSLGVFACAECTSKS